MPSPYLFSTHSSLTHKLDQRDDFTYAASVPCGILHVSPSISTSSSLTNDERDQRETASGLPAPAWSGHAPALPWGGRVVSSPAPVHTPPPPRPSPCLMLLLSPTADITDASGDAELLLDITVEALKVCVLVRRVPRCPDELNCIPDEL